MNKRIKKPWIKALRSGRYKQGRYSLQDKGKFCCLGVLCDLHSKEMEIEWDDGSPMEYLGQESSLPDEVIEWAGIETAQIFDSGNPRLGIRSGSVSAIRVNDSGKSFNYIADRIEKYL